MITVIILLILAGVALSLVIGENGLIAKSKQGVEKYKDKTKEEQWQLEDFEAGIEEISLAELEDEEKHPELKAMELVLEITEDNTEIYVPVYRYRDDYKYDFRIDWGDETENNQVTNANVKTTTHTYANSGTYTISIEGICESLYMGYDNNLIEIKQWGSTGLKNLDLIGCSNLTKIATPSKNSFINVTTFFEAFYKCSNLSEIPEKLFANCPNIESFSGTFSRCSSLINIPERLFANCPNATNFYETFYECYSLKEIPGRLFVNCSQVETFQNTFGQCSSLISIPENLFASCNSIEIFNATFSWCMNLKEIPEGLFANCNNVKIFQETFRECNSLKSIPEGLFENCPNVTEFDNTFRECSSLTNIPKNLFEKCLNVMSFEKTFYQCNNLTGKSIQLWNEEDRQEKGITKDSGGNACYAGCEKLDDYEDIPDYWKFDSGPR